jgi:hypothetical protein
MYAIASVTVQRYIITIRDMVRVPLQFHNFWRYITTYLFDVFIKNFRPQYPIFFLAYSPLNPLPNKPIVVMEAKVVEQAHPHGSMFCILWHS